MQTASGPSPLLSPVPAIALLWPGPLRCPQGCCGIKDIPEVSILLWGRSM